MVLPGRILHPEQQGGTGSGSSGIGALVMSTARNQRQMASVPVQTVRRSRMLAVDFAGLVPGVCEIGVKLHLRARFVWQRGGFVVWRVFLCVV
eukprot:878452-Rhodomonas_salina.6